MPGISRGGHLVWDVALRQPAQKVLTKLSKLGLCG